MKKIKERKFLIIFSVITSTILLIIIAYIGFQKFIEKEKKKVEHNWYLSMAKKEKISLGNYAYQEFIKKNSHPEDDYEGVGAILELLNKVIFIEEIILNSPAEKAGLKRGDKIITIDGKYTLGMDTTDMVEALRGPKGTQVSLEIYRDSFGDKSRKFVVTRDLIDNSERRNYFAFIENNVGAEELGNGYIAYKNKVYFQGYMDGQVVPMKEFVDLNRNETETFSPDCPEKNLAETKVFKPCTYLAKDSKKIFLGSIEISGADPETFEVLKKDNIFNFGKDQNSVFYKNQKINDADPRTFEIISDDYSKDQNNIYLMEMSIPNADVESFKLIDASKRLSKDKNNYYVGARKTDYAEFKKILDSKDPFGIY